MNEEECWICQTQNEALQCIHPCCCCSGSIGMVHRECLHTWIANSGNLFCPNCKHAYSMVPQDETSERMHRWLIAKCILLATVEVGCLFLFLHATLVLFTVGFYISGIEVVSDPDPWVTLLFSLCGAYGMWILFFAVMVILVSIVSCCLQGTPHTSHCCCECCRYGNRSAITDLWIMMWLMNSGGGGGNTSCHCDGGSGADCGSGGGNDNGEAVSIMIVVIGILVLMCLMFIFYVIFLALSFAIVKRHVSKYYAQRKMKSFYVRDLKENVSF